MLGGFERLSPTATFVLQKLYERFIVAGAR